MLRKEEQKTEKRLRVPPEAYLAIQLEEMNSRLADIHDALRRQVPQGFKEEVDVTVQGTIPVPMEPKLRKPPFVRASLFVDADSDPVYVMLNEVKPEAFRDAPLNAEEKLDIDTTEPKIEALFFACQAPENRATIRVHLLK